MICCITTAATNDDMLDGLRQAAGQPVELHGIMFDAMAEAPDVQRLIAASTRPVVAICRSRADGGDFAGGDDERQDILRRALAAGAGYVDASPADVAALAPHKGDAVLIASIRDNRETPANLEERLHELAQLPADWIGFAVAVRHPADNLRIFEAIAASPKPCIGVGLGDVGLMTRILGPALGSKITFGPLHADASDPFRPTARDLAEIYRVNEITENTRVYGVLGNAVGLSPAPRLFNEGFRDFGFDAVFIPFQADSAGPFFSTIPQGLDLQGLSVASPHKQAALAWAESSSEAARRIGAANTLTLRRDGWHADNTDCLALFEVLKYTTDAAGLSLCNAPALVLGSGATSRAIGVALTLAGCRVTIASRNRESSRQLAWDMNWDSEEWGDAGHGNWRVVANGTPLGGTSDPDATPFPTSAWRPDMIAFDAVYQPGHTRFIQDALKAGAIPVDLEQLLYRQAAGQFRMWTGIELPGADFKP